MRFNTEYDTPCPFRLARFGYERIREFRAPKYGELYIQPAEGPGLQEHEPVILGACEDFPADQPRHIVRALEEGQEPEITIIDLLGALFGPEPEEDEAA